MRVIIVIKYVKSPLGFQGMAYFQILTINIVTPLSYSDFFCKSFSWYSPRLYIQPLNIKENKKYIF